MAATIVAGRHPQVFCAVTAEVAQRGEIHAVGNLRERQSLVFKIIFQYWHSGTVYIRCDAVPCQSFYGGREVLGRHVQALGIVVNAALGAANSSRQQFHERLHNVAGETSLRQEKDSFMHFKYDSTAEQDNHIVERVVELADRYGVEMTQISLAWLLTKVESPIVGATKLHHIEGAVKALDVHLTDADIRYLEEPYVPHNLSGVMAVNKPAMSEEPVWVKASKNK